MCRWLAYSGAPIFLDEVLFRTEHSLIDQSIRALDPHQTTNGDGFGLGWYSNRDVPGLYRDIRPAWNDKNLQALAAQIESPMFLAHVRATTGSPVQRTNCHPFGHDRWLFVHNGLINDYDKLRRDLTIAIAPQMTLGISDGESLYAVRYSTEGDSRSLFHSVSRDATMEIAPDAGRFSRNARAIVSEPLNDLEAEWLAVPEASYLTITRGKITCESFAPIAP